ncbi:type II toxin-antitoxin system VapC family toxin [Neorhizobium galegae]|uniref:type II toxin-antitoxin system VapC family toxin n=1 Tax=Neorhizobium galegae TaxID=399 RepID=UPI00062105DF|nr:type II toxin-antitoxin system VapC family toxin [Neorhizobium galegae]MCQ1765097.1 type II toxin-antitoxin system VapC family toxin [Neorhizobium galegae]MCQ1844010.1 type II toxin-antitoxin system VapC family toxin [Neorhizobium galegae]CDZ33865.1 Putative nucleic acid-binding protein, contains PIN domain-containing protein [Neorhizobium galegae bv. officinalis]
MRVVDSSAWIEWLIDSPLAVRLAGAIPEKQELIVPTIVQMEMCKWLMREKGEEAAERFISYTTECLVVELGTEIAWDAAEVSRSFKLSTADAIIYATARFLDADLLTCDRHFENLPHVVYIPKPGAEA